MDMGFFTPLCSVQNDRLVLSSPEERHQDFTELVDRHAEQPFLRRVKASQQCKQEK
jgi:hypothetical protein